MQRISKYALILLAVLLLVACAPAIQAPESVDTGSVTAVEEVANEAASEVSEEVVEASAEEAADVEVAEVASVPVLSGPTDDITLIGATGRPQFLNSYADW